MFYSIATRSQIAELIISAAAGDCRLEYGGVRLVGKCDRTAVYGCFSRFELAVSVGINEDYSAYVEQINWRRSRHGGGGGAGGGEPARPPPHLRARESNSVVPENRSRR